MNEYSLAKLQSIYLQHLFCYLRQLFEPQQVIYLNFEKFGNLHEGVKGRLSRVCTPFADGCVIFVQLFGQPFIGPLLVGQYCFDSIQILCHRNVLFDYTGAKIIKIPLLSCYKRINLRKYMLFYGELRTFPIVISIFAGMKQK